jgi:beta-1,4-N-acetylglucosaminyltransferase
MKIGLVCSHGGHLTETLQLMEAFHGHELFFATYTSSRNTDIKTIAQAYFCENTSANPYKLLKALIRALPIILREKPDVLISLGAEIALPFFFWGKLFGSRLIFIESWCRVEDLSLTGKIVYPFVDAFWVQWPQLLKNCGPKAEYHGTVI